MIIRNDSNICKGLLNGKSDSNEH